MSQASVVDGRTGRHSTTLGVIALLAVALSCSDPAPPEPEVASIELSVPVTGAVMRFRDPLVVRATPQAALGVPLERDVTWTAVTPALLSVQALAPDGDSARIRATGVGTGQIRVSAGDISQTFDVTVQDTVFSVSITPGPLSLVAGDTVTYRATITGPPNADQTISWEVTNPTVLQTLASPDPTVLRVQARGAGSASVRAIALADATKASTSAVTSQIGKLVFVVQPSAAQREVPFNVSPTVEVQDVAGNRSPRAANEITLTAGPGSCNGTVVGSAVIASGGIAVFPRAAATVRCPDFVLAATAVPTAAPAVSQPFVVNARDCAGVVPFSRIDTVHAVIESGDCVVTRAGKQFFAHTYELTVPAASQLLSFRMNTTSTSFFPRVESYITSLDPTVGWTDSLNLVGTLGNSYWLPPGTHRFVVTAPTPIGTGAYTVAAPGGGGAGGNQLPGCLIVTTPGVTVLGQTLQGDECHRQFASRPGESPGRHFLIYLRANKTVQVTYRPTGTAVDNDAYLEVFDVTTTPGLSTPIKFDDNSGGGVRGTDAQLTVDPAPTGRFLLIRAARVGGGGTSFFNLTISE